jgi:hypothetical protein
MPECEQDVDTTERHLEAKVALLKLHLVMCNLIFPSLRGAFAMGAQAQKVIQLALGDEAILLPNWNNHYFLHPAFFCRKPILQDYLEILMLEDKFKCQPMTVKQAWRTMGRKILSPGAFPVIHLIVWNFLRGSCTGISPELRPRLLEAGFLILRNNGRMYNFVPDVHDWSTLEQEVCSMSISRKMSLLENLD